MYTFKNAISKDLAYEQIMAFTENFKHAPEQKVSVIEEIIRNNLPTETVFGYVMYPPNQLTDAEVINAMRYNDSKDTHFIHFTMWYELTFVFLDLQAKQVMCWGTQKNVKDALEGIQELLNNAIQKNIQKQRQEQIQAWIAEDQEKRADDRMDCWDKDYMANKHL